MEPYRDSSQSIDARVKDLLSRMTLDEKLAQIGSIFSNEVIDGGQFSAEKAAGLIKNGIGEISRPATATGLPLKEVAIFVNGVQRFLVESTRLGIPAICHEECLSGFMAKEATLFPQIIGLASTWEPELVGRITDVIREQMRAVGTHQGLAPVLDVARDPRWGRVEETYGEDPYLVATMGTSYVKGLQGNDIKEGVVATPKHFVGYGLSEGGLNQAPSHIPPRLLREVYLYPFKEAITMGGALSLMNSYQEIDGIPCGASRELLTDILRGEWGFEGIVVSDYVAIDLLQAYHKIAADKGGAARLALEAGIDIELPRYDCYAGPLKELINSRQVAEELIDLAVSRVLKVKMMLGLFERLYVEPDGVAGVFGVAEHWRLSLEAARKSMVLLKNGGNTLPLKKDINAIAVIGPNADSRRNLLGDYSYYAHEEFQLARASATSGSQQDRDNQTDPDSIPVVSILEGIKAKVSKNTKVIYAEGCEVNSTARGGFKEAIEAAREADVAVVVVGGKSGLGFDCTCGEMRDRAELGLPGVQEELVKAVYDTGTPVVLVLVNGRPYTLEWAAEKIPAILEAWLPGEEGGNAVADVLFGDYNPGGKLPISFPQKVGQVPVYYGHKRSGGRSQVWGDYVDGSTSPVFEFGYGLSYTTFNFDNLWIEPTRLPMNGTVSIRVDVTNTGTRAGEEVVQLYINDRVASVTRPVKELKGFKRIALEPAERMTVEFKLPAEALAFYNKEMKLVVEPGIFKVYVGRSSRDTVLEGEFEIEA